MFLSQSLGQLRETLSAIERRGQTAHATLPFGIAPLDQRLAAGGLRIDALHEIAAARADWGDDAAATLFLAGIAARSGGTVLWIARRRDLFAPGLYQSGLKPERLIHAETRDDAETLAVMEDAIRYGGLSAVIGEVRRAGMTATRRLQLAAEGGRTLVMLLRQHARAGIDPLGHPSAAATRWRVEATPSAPLSVAGLGAGLGRAHWRITLVRQRGGAPFEIELEACDETGRCALVAGMVDRPDSARRADARAA